MQLKKATPILFVDAIEPCLPFWIDRLGFAEVARVPEGDRLGFVILVAGELEVMLQTRESVEKDLKLPAPTGGCLYFTVDAIEPLLAKLAGSEVAVERRKTFYGADEIFVREPGGNLIGFAAH